MDVDKECDYYHNVTSRSWGRFVKGLIPRLLKFAKYERARKIAIKGGAKIGKNSIVVPLLAKKANSKLSIGDYSSIDSHKIDLRSCVTIGNYVIISNDCEIITTSHYIDSPEGAHKYYGLEIEDYVWIASNVLILPSCKKIGYGAVIGAGAVVVKDVPAMSVMGGNPATCIRRRGQVHNKLVIPSLLSGDLKLYWKVWMDRKK